MKILDKNYRIKQQESEWQNIYGGALQKSSYDRLGTRVVIHRQFKRILQALEIEPGMRVLDVGCGMGHLLNWMSGNYLADYYGIDLAVNTLQTAREMNPLFKLGVADAERLPFRAGSFDRVICNGSAHHFLDPSSAVREIFRVLDASGKLVMYEPVSTPVTKAARKLFLQDDRFESPADLSKKEHFTKESLERLLSQIGFINISGKFYDFIAYPLSGMYMDFPLSHSVKAMKSLCWIENQLERCSLFSFIFNALSYRLLVKAEKS